MKQAVVAFRLGVTGRRSGATWDQSTGRSRARDAPEAICKCSVGSCSSPRRDCANHVVRRQRPPDPFQLELADWLDLHGVLDLRQDARADEDLPWLGFVAKARGNVGHCTDGGIVEPALEADSA